MKGLAYVNRCCPDCGFSVIRQAPPNGGKSWRCVSCGWQGDTGNTCTQAWKVCKKCNLKRYLTDFQKADNVWCIECRKVWAHMVVPEYDDMIYDLPKKKAKEPSKTQVNAGVMKKGDIKELSSMTVPPFSKQWAYQGSGKFPYIVTHKRLEWLCSCPAWTTTIPREDCKHVLKIKLSLGLKTAPLFTGKDPDTPKGVLALFDKKGRKFR